MDAFPKSRASESESGFDEASAGAVRRDRKWTRLGLPLQTTDSMAEILAPQPTMDWHRIASGCAPLSPSARTSITAVWVPLRHLCWAASLNGASLRPSNSIRHPLTQSVLHLQRACFFSALGWALGGAGALSSAQGIWLDHPAWQGLRRYAEDALALSDPQECAFAFSLMLDGVLRPQLGGDALRRCGGDEADALVLYLEELIESSVTDLFREDSTTLARWAPRAASAGLPVVEQVWGHHTDARLGAAMEKLAIWALPEAGAVRIRCA